MRLGAISPLLKTRNVMPCRSWLRMKLGNGKKEPEWPGACRGWAKNQTGAVAVDLKVSAGRR